MPEQLSSEQTASSVTPERSASFRERASNVLRDVVLSAVLITDAEHARIAFKKLHETDTLPQA